MLNKIILFGLVLVMGLAFANGGPPPYIGNQYERAACMYLAADNMAAYAEDVYCGSEECSDELSGLVDETFDYYWDVWWYAYEEPDYALSAQNFAQVVTHFNQFRAVYLRYAILRALDGGNMSDVMGQYMEYMAGLNECFVEGPPAP
ncbi:hypothetical protein H0O00_01290 [Candidatus Micrarchaeota archaeon]|nr:hypothetical protein [Candidatus Micrarchaeota archaeon]